MAATTSSTATPAKNSLDYIAGLINRRKMEHGSDPAKQRTKGVTFHNFSWTKRSDVVPTPGPDPGGADVTRTLDVGDLVTNQLNDFPGASGQIQSKGLVQYVVLQRADRDGSGWMLPSPQQFHDIVNTVESEIISKKLDFISVLRWANLWNDTGLVGLSSNDLKRMGDFRDFFHSQRRGGMIYSLVPKELVAQKTTISTLLKYCYRNYDLASLPGGLFKRNLELDGSLVVTKSRIFGPNDKTLKGETKDGWRYVELEADAVFMKVLEQFPETHRFTLGSDSIQLWGGKRKQTTGANNQKTTPTGRSSRARSNFGGTGGAGPSGLNDNNNNYRPRARIVALPPPTPTIDLTKDGTEGTGAGENKKKNAVAQQGEEI